MFNETSTPPTSREVLALALDFAITCELESLGSTIYKTLSEDARDEQSEGIRQVYILSEARRNLLRSGVILDEYTGPWESLTKAERRAVNARTLEDAEEAMEAEEDVAYAIVQARGDGVLADASR